MNATLKLLDMAARILNSGYDVEVFEAHHRNKVDAPSGTALKMGETIASAWDVALPDVATWSRHGDTGVRKPGTIGFSVLRGGDIVGDHTVSFCGIGERIEITHRSSSRVTYAQGAARRELPGRQAQRAVRHAVGAGSLSAIPMPPLAAWRRPTGMAGA